MNKIKTALNKCIPLMIKNKLFIGTTIIGTATIGLLPTIIVGTILTYLKDDIKVFVKKNIIKYSLIKNIWKK